jgi:hypothetical protein
LRDTGSTNGTFVGGSQIREQKLENGQAIRVGGVEMTYYADTNAGAAAIGTAAARPVVRVAAAAAAPLVAKVVEAPAAVPVLEATPVVESATAIAPEIATGPRYCKYHPKTPARHLCPKCNRAYCDVCINFTQMGDKTVRNCRTCGVEVVPFQFRPAPAKSFYRKVPGAFGYPFKGAGIVILVCATIAFAALNFIGFILIKILLYGFVFLFMQNIILTTTSDEKADLSFPDPSSLFGAAVQLGGAVVASFWPALALEIAKFDGMAVPPEAIIASVILGGIYFPMALLAVAMKDTALAANPLIVIPAMMKAPLKYSVTAVLTLVVFGIRQLGGMISGGAGKVMVRTHSWNMFYATVGYQMVWALVSVYLLVVTMRLLGLFYNSSKQKLGWYTT